MKNFSLINLLTILLAGNFAYAQKLPGVQQGGLLAPANIKIDGKATEWGDKFQAYNKNIEAFYTLSNDDEKIYLTVKATTHDIASKILRGGLTLIINHTVKKNDPEAVSLTYPVLRGGDMAAVTNMYARRSFKQEDGEEASVKQLNDLLEAKSKTIEVTGIKTITDKDISVYNEEGIKAAALFDDRNAYICEIAIPLKYLNLPNGESFSYHIKINEEPTTSKASNGPPPPPVFIGALGTTDFWGEYTLAKK